MLLAQTKGSAHFAVIGTSTVQSTAGAAGLTMATAPIPRVVSTTALTKVRLLTTPLVLRLA